MLKLMKLSAHARINAAPSALSLFMGFFRFFLRLGASFRVWLPVLGVDVYPAPPALVLSLAPAWDWLSAVCSAESLQPIHAHVVAKR